MESIYTTSKLQYSYVCSSRSALMDYCNTIKNEDFLKETDSMGRGGSIRNLLVHIANTYQGWIKDNALKEETTYYSAQNCTNVEMAEMIFSEVDEFMERFFESILRQNVPFITMILDDQPASVEPFKIYSHVITHEFHHKGQILSRSRQLGYIPIDTDIMR
jgi:uncharacterized damage-inducible protein DinB